MEIDKAAGGPRRTRGSSFVRHCHFQNVVPGRHVGSQRESRGYQAVSALLNGIRHWRRCAHEHRVPAGVDDGLDFDMRLLLVIDQWIEDGVRDLQGATLPKDAYCFALLRIER